MEWWLPGSLHAEPETENPSSTSFLFSQEITVQSLIQLCPTLCDPMDCSHQAALSMGFSRQEHWNGLPFLSPRNNYLFIKRYQFTNILRVLKMFLLHCSNFLKFLHFTDQKICFTFLFENNHRFTVSWKDSTERCCVLITQFTHCVCACMCACVCVWAAQLCLTLCNPRDCSPPDSSVHGILQGRILECVAVPFSRGSSPLRNWTWVSCIAGRLFTFWAIREALIYFISYILFKYSATSKPGNWHWYELSASFSNEKKRILFPFPDILELPSQLHPSDDRAFPHYLPCDICILDYGIGVRGGYKWLCERGLGVLSGGKDGRTVLTGGH